MPSSCERRGSWKKRTRDERGPGETSPGKIDYAVFSTDPVLTCLHLIMTERGRGAAPC